MQPLQEGRPIDFHTSNIQRVRTERSARCCVRLGNPIGRPPEGRFDDGNETTKRTTERPAFQARSAISFSSASFLPVLFWQDRKEWAAGGTPRHSPAQKRYGPQSGGCGFANRTAPSTHSKCTAGGIPHRLVQKRMCSLPL